MRIEVPSWLRQDPDTDVDHDYLTEEEIDVLPDGVFFKRKATLTRHRFVKATILVDGFPVVIEMVDNRGSWQFSAAAFSKLRGRLPAEVAGVGEEGLLALLGLTDTVRPEGVPLPPSRVRHPQTYDDVVGLYRDYSDMEKQGHFTDDSPDIDRLRAVIAATPAGSRVVDLGCNSGAFGARLIEGNGCVVAGVDLAHRLLIEARRKGVQAVRAFAERTPFRSGAFDVVLCCELLEHVLDPDLLLEEARRLVRPGGLLVITVPHANGEWGEHDVPYHAEHLRAYREDDLNALVQAHGFKVTQMLVHHYGHTAPQELVMSAARYR
ncbi:class I SAM-dependent methyltransferase [Streptomyces sp. CHD11]|uniref:class I SAM-dependent methyltransferase n=1 Tax=Streptomyces sp. CHD11 TaxID=2741325 RepID=UPI001BFC77B3|nr:class I SAM-dependent methyltransferase [Streptomyces sp. CHD11]MBT3155343.1 class I SAM-dependent methyltransferase [Streptomyces sp. CHD11]